MKIVLTKNLDEEKAKARLALDESLYIAIFRALGSKAMLYTVKNAAAMAHLGGVRSPLIASDDDAKLIISKFAEYTHAIAGVETVRQTLQASIDAAKTSKEIDEIVAGFGDRIKLSSAPSAL